jgi:hypothetical protein
VAVGLFFGRKVTAENNPHESYDLTDATDQPRNEYQGEQEGELYPIEWAI